MQYKECTATEAAIDFADNVFPGIDFGVRNAANKEYRRVLQFCKDARKPGGITDARAMSILERWGGDKYRVAISFEIQVHEK